MIRQPSYFAALALLLAACGNEPDRQHVLSEPVYSQQYRDGALTVIVSLSETNIATSGEITLMIDAHAPADAEVQVPEIQNLIAPFTVADGYAEPTRVLPNGKQLYRRVWTLIPSLPGEAVFQPLEITAGPDHVATAPISSHVSSRLPEGLETMEIMDIAEPVALLPEETRERKLWFILAGAAGIAMLLTLATKLSRRAKPVVVLLPHEAAFLALERLPDDESRRIQTLSDILFTFIAARFNIPTAGQTLNEILPRLPKHLLLGRRAPLERMLAQSEQTRFSNHTPTGFAAELEKYVRSFVSELKEEPCD